MFTQHKSRLRRGTIGLLAVCFTVIGASASASPIYAVSFNDPGNTFSSFYGQISSNLLAAGSDWNRFLGGQSVSLELLVQFSSAIPTMQGGSVTTAFVGTSGGFNIFEQGATHELRTGIDPNGAVADATITIGTAYLMNELWFDPNPLARLDPVPIGQTDAESAFIHELGHILGFNGFLNPLNGQPPGNFLSTYDQFVTFNGSDLFFNGALAESIYGGPVPLTLGNYTHVGNSSPRPGSDLLPDLMNGVSFQRGVRYEISTLDLAIASDVGVPLSAAAVPEPASVVLLSTGTLGVFLLRRRRRRSEVAALIVK